MRLDPEVCERARQSRDPRFDGRFFIGVKTTGIYCRPICPVRMPKAENVTFFPTAAAAAAAGFRPCLRCRPELSAGTSSVAGTSRTVRRALRLIERGEADDGGVAAIARITGVTARHLGRLFQQELGASPLAIVRTRRLHFAKRLLDETDLSMSDVAYSSGFRSLRRFNAVFRETYGRTPTEIRSASRRRGIGPAPKPEPVGCEAVEVDVRPSFTFRLDYRPPLDWVALLDFLRPRVTPGVEAVTGDEYRRTFRLGGAGGTLHVRPVPDKPALELMVSICGAHRLLEVVERVRHMCDLGAEPDSIASTLHQDALLRPRITRRPGLRVPGAWDGFELAVRAILGQQVTVRGATTLAGRLAETFGEPLPPANGLACTFPTPERLADADLTVIGLPKARANAIGHLARAVAGDSLALQPGGDPDDVVETLLALPGIGDWTAQYVCMRALGEPDAFPSSDLGLLKAVGEGRGAAAARSLRDRSETWRPWRAYAAMHLWQSDLEA